MAFWKVKSQIIYVIPNHSNDIMNNQLNFFFFFFLGCWYVIAKYF
jgi:hypothetical protein